MGVVSPRDHLAAVKAEIQEVSDDRAAELLASEGAAFIDVRERDEYEQGFIPGATHIARGFLESRIESAVPDRERRVVLYCASGGGGGVPARAPTAPPTRPRR